VSDLAVVPKPLQQPHPPVFVAAGSPETYAATGRRGLGILVPGHVQPLEAAREHLADYWQAGRTAKHEERLRVTFLIPIYVAERQQQAEAEPEPHVMYYYRVLGELLAGEFPESYQRYGESRRRLGTLSYEVIRRQRAIFGEPSYCLERLQQLRETLDIQQLMAWMNIGGLPHDKVLRSMRLFAERVLPALE
jgi:alkanesulfonate monooxygenase SsuD/methylene tetrahydromethanopterin reductase-like flavin-dependent oxidoreductase (luciferase family)